MKQIIPSKWRARYGAHIDHINSGEPARIALVWVELTTASETRKLTYPERNMLKYSLDLLARAPSDGSKIKPVTVWEMFVSGLRQVVGVAAYIALWCILPIAMLFIHLMFITYACLNYEGKQ